MTDRELVARIAASAGGRAGYKQLVRELGLGGGRERRLLREQLARLTLRGQLAQLDREQWSLPAAAGRSGPSRADAGGNLVAGRLHLHRDGYGFVRPERGSLPRGSAERDDIFIPPGEIGGAMHGDQVLAEVAPPAADGRCAGRILRVLERRNPTVVGAFHFADPRRGQRQNIVVPFDARMTQPILIPSGQEIPPGDAAAPHRVLGHEATARPKLKSPEGEGLIVDVEIVSWPTPTRPPTGRVIEILGAPDDFGVDVEMTIRKHQLPRIFPDAVLAEARSVAHFDPEAAARRADFRDLPIVTIDGATAKDFDDAVLVRQRAEGGYELQVHIADVAEYVRSGSALDTEARLRGTSVYFPDRALPMLPQELSTGICSLRPQEDRLTLSCLMQLDAEGRILSFEIVEGLIRSAARMTYAEVTAILAGDAEVRARYAPLVAEFERMKELAVLMNRRRAARGSIDFDLPEPVIEFDENGQMCGITRAERTWANRLIEEFMLAANECVAVWLEDLGVPSLYRIHERPEARRVIEFEEQAASFGFSLGLGPLPVRRTQFRAERRASRGQGRNPRLHEIPEEIAVTPRMYQKLAARLEGKSEERILSYLMLRSLAQARYSETNEGHFALAAPTYTHFTSPIRRYPDLIVHRIAKTLLAAGVSGCGTLSPARRDSPWSHPNEGNAGASLPLTTYGKSSVLKGHGLSRADNQPVMNETLAHEGRFSQDLDSHPRLPTSPTPLTPLSLSELAEIADEASAAERRAAEAERELVEWKKLRFMKDKVGDEFAALVLNPAKYGLFVELTDLFVEGLVPIDTLRGDRFTWRENTHEIVGERTGRCFRAGDRVQVILDRILAQERKLQFALVEEELVLTGRKPPQPSAKAKKRAKKEAARRENSAQRRKQKPPKRRGRH